MKQLNFNQYKNPAHTPRLYIAYGSNMNLQQMRHRCPGSKVVGTAMLQDYELLFRSVATIEPKPGGEVPVLVWDISARDERALDAYEGWPRLYRKEDVEVELDGKPVSAMAYIMNGGHEIFPPDWNYYNCILEGYNAAGFDPKILEEAVRQSEMRMDRPQGPQMDFWDMKPW